MRRDRFQEWLEARSRPLSDEQQQALEDMTRHMREQVIPETIQEMRKNAIRAAEIRHRGTPLFGTV